MKNFTRSSPVFFKMFSKQLVLKGSGKKLIATEAPVESSCSNVTTSFTSLLRVIDCSAQKHFAWHTNYLARTVKIVSQVEKEALLGKGVPKMSHLPNKYKALYRYKSQSRLKFRRHIGFSNLSFSFQGLKSKIFTTNMCLSANLVLQNKVLYNLVFWKSCSKTNYKIARPLLKCSRNIVTRACLATKMPVYPDTSNSLIQYSRNRIRKQIIPSFRFFFNPQVENSIFKFSEVENKEHILKNFVR